MTRRLKLHVLGLLVLGLLSGCGMFSSSSTTAGGGSSTAAGGGGAPWIVTTRGSATPSPGLPFANGAPRPTPSFGFLPLRAGGAPRATPAPGCSVNTYDFSQIGGLDVTTSATTAKLSWINVGGYNLVEFRLYAISQDLKVGGQRDVGWVTVKPDAPCGAMTGTVVNLDPRTTYVFSVDAVVTRRSGDGTHAATVFRSHPIRTL